MTNSPSTPFDLDGLYDMYGKETVKELLQMSVNEAQGLLAQIDEGITLNESKPVMTAAHQLKGLASTMTIKALAKLSLELEAAARQEQWDIIASTQQELKKELERVARYVAVVLRP